jgi:hypothetical protein
VEFESFRKSHRFDRRLLKDLEDENLDLVKDGEV